MIPTATLIEPYIADCTDWCFFTDNETDVWENRRCDDIAWAVSSHPQYDGYEGWLFVEHRFDWIISYHVYRVIGSFVFPVWADQHWSV